MAKFSPSYSRLDDCYGCGSCTCGKGFAEFGPGDVEGLGEDAGFGGDGHEVGVAAPAREGVEVDVIGDAGTGGFAEVQAEVEAVGMVDLAETALDALGGEDHLLGGLRAGGRRGSRDADRAG